MTLHLPVLLAGVALWHGSGTASAADIVDTAVAGKFNTLVAAVKAAGLVDTLKGPGPFTVFAPTDEAFAKLPPGTLENLLKPENKAKLAEAFSRITWWRASDGQDVVKLDSAKTVEGGSVTIKAMEWRRDGEQRARDQDRYCDEQRRDSRHRHGAPARMRVSCMYLLTGATDTSEDAC